MKKLLIASALATIGLGTAASAQDLYSTFPGSCNLGEEGVVGIGRGVVHLMDGDMRRASAKRDIGNGYFEAEYDITGEGEDYGRETVRMRITDRETRIIFRDGRDISAKRCR